MEVGAGSSKEGSSARRTRSGTAARAPSPEPISAALAGLVEVLGVPALQQSLQRPSDEAALAAMDLASLGEAMGFPHHPAVNGAMQLLWGALEAPAPSWMASLPETLAGFDLECSKVPTLKALCRACELPVDGKKAELQERLRDAQLLDLLPQHIPLAVALAVEPELAEVCGRVERRAQLTQALASRGVMSLPDLEPQKIKSAWENYVVSGVGELPRIAEAIAEATQRRGQLKQALAALGVKEPVGDDFEQNIRGTWEDYVAYGRGEIPQIVKDIVGRVERGHQLEQALAARGLKRPCESNFMLDCDSDVWEGYINFGIGELPDAVEAVAEKNFYDNYTNYPNEKFQECDFDRDGGDGYWDGICEHNNTAKEWALFYWVVEKHAQPGATLEQCLAARELASTLHASVRSAWAKLEA